VSEAGGSTFWKATDEILARSVAVLTFDPGFPRVSEVVTAARAASRLTDPRLTQVFDAEDAGERAYVVSEWVTGETLNDLLAHGPMEPDRAAAFLLEAAEALTSAHAAGLAHLCLTPHNLVWTSSGTVKITGLGVEAVLSGATSDTPELDDARGLGKLLYAALTGYWPGGENTGLQAPPTGGDGRALPPGQVRAGIPHNLDSIVCRTLGLPAHGSQGPLESPAAFTDAISRVPRSPLPFVPLVGSTPPAVVPRPEAHEHTRAMTAPTPVPPAQTIPDSARIRHRVPARPAYERTADHGHEGGHGGHRSPAGGRGPLSRPVLAVAAVIAVVILAVGGWGLSRLGGSGGEPRSRPSATASRSSAPSTQVLQPVGAHAFNPAPHPDSSADQGTDKAIDASKSSSWKTQYYFDDQFGRLRKGVGLVIDMGKAVTVDKVTVTMPDGTPGTVELHVGSAGTNADPTVATSTAASGTFDLSGRPTEGQYVTLWFTKLPNVNGKFQIFVKDVKITGTP
jgi:hypothetical protein